MGYVVRTFNFNEDSDALFKLWTSVLKHPSLQRMEHMYRNNSFGMPISSLVFHDKEGLVCSTSAFPIKGVFGKRSLLLGINYDMLALPRHRTLGPTLMSLKGLLKECKASGYDLLLAMPNEMSRAVFQRAGYQKLGTAYRWSKVLSSENKLRHAIKSHLLRQLVATFADMSLRFASVEPWIRFRYLALGTRYKTDIGLLGDIPSKLSATTDNFLLKTPRYLQWRYDGLPHYNPQVFLLYQDNNVSGYVIYRIEDGEVIVEEIFLPASNGHDYILLAGFVSEMRAQRQKGVSILYLGPSDLEEKLKKLGFLKREGRDVYIYVFGEVDRELSKLIVNLTFFDADLDL